MHIARLVIGWTTGSLLLLTGCSGSGALSPVTPQTGSPNAAPSPPAMQAELGTHYQSGDLQQAALAIYTLRVDPDSLTATSGLKAIRAAAANDDLYLLEIGNFLRPDSFRVTEVRATASTIDVAYRVTHPFPAPADPTGVPNGSTNRADLGITGMVLVLADVPSATGNTYFTDRVVNTGLMANADAYYSPGGLLTISGTANTFPYRQLVDELADGTGSRLGISNGGEVTGNYGIDGWTRAEFGASNDGWTGYGVLHQGQSSANTFSFNKAAITSGLDLEVAIVAKYNDPRGGATAAEKKANRLPPESADAFRFAYRMPHGALDAGRIIALPEPAGFIANTISSQQMSFYVEDWDTRAFETAAGDLAADAEFTNVDVGAAGPPDLDVCIPGVLGDPTFTVPITTLIDDDTAYGGDFAQDSGRPGDALCYSQLVTKSAGLGQVAQSYSGMVRAQSELDFVALDPSLGPLATPPDPVSYQAFTVQLQPDASAPTATVALTSADPLLSGTSASVSITGIADANNDPIDILVNWGDAGGFVPVVTGLMPPYANQTPSSPAMSNADLTPDLINVTVRLDDGTSQVDYPFSYTLGPNRPPQVSGSPALSSASVLTPAIFTMTAGSGIALDPEGDAVSYTITNNRNGDAPTFATFPNPANPTAITNPPHSTVTFTVYANDALHPTTSGTSWPGINGVISDGTSTGWVYAPTSSTTGVDHPYDVAFDPSGDVWVVGDWATTAPGVNFGGGLVSNLTGRPMFLLKLSGVDGAYQLVRTWTASSTASRCVSVASDNTGNIYVSLTWSGTLSIAGLGGGAVDHTSNGTGGELGILKFDNSGNYLGIVRSNDPVNESAEAAPTVQSVPTTAFAGVGQAGLQLDQASGSLYALLCPAGSGTCDFGGTTVAVDNTGRDALLIRYPLTGFTPAGTGPATWAVNLSTGGTDVRAQGMTIDPGGNIVIGGSFFGTGVDFGDGPNSTSATLQDLDAFLTKRTSAGAFIPGSSRVLRSSTTGGESLASLASDATGIYVGGSFGYLTSGATFTLGAPLGNLVANGADGYIGKFTHAGVPVWQRHITGATSEVINGGIHVNGSNISIYGTSNSTSAVDWGYPALVSFASVDPVLAKYDANSGAAGLWASTWGSAGLDYSSASAMNAGGDSAVVMRVATAGTYDFDPGPGTALKTTVTSEIVVVKVLGATGAF